MKLDSILLDFLGSVNGASPPTLGDEVKVAPKPEATDLLYERLSEQAKYNNRVVTLIIVLQCVVFVLGIALVLGLRASPVGATAAGGGSLAALLAITRRLQRLWEVKSALDLLIAVLPSLPPAEVVRVVQAIYFKRQLESAGAAAVAARS